MNDIADDDRIGWVKEGLIGLGGNHIKVGLLYSVHFLSVIPMTIVLFLEEKILFVCMLYQVDC